MTTLISQTTDVFPADGRLSAKCSGLSPPQPHAPFYRKHLGQGARDLQGGPSNPTSPPRTLERPSVLRRAVFKPAGGGSRWRSRRVRCDALWGGRCSQEEARIHGPWGGPELAAGGGLTPDTERAAGPPAGRPPGPAALAALGAQSQETKQPGDAFRGTSSWLPPQRPSRRRGGGCLPNEGRGSRAASSWLPGTRRRTYLALRPGQRRRLPVGCPLRLSPPSMAACPPEAHLPAPGLPAAALPASCVRGGRQPRIPPHAARLAGGLPRRLPAPPGLALGRGQSALSRPWVPWGLHGGLGGGCPAAEGSEGKTGRAGKAGAWEGQRQRPGVTKQLHVLSAPRLQLKMDNGPASLCVS